MQVRLLTINRYRGIERFDWRPRPGVNCLIGPGDSLKSTVLSAIALLLAPFPLGACSEFDFYRRRFADGFEIEAYIGNIDIDALGAEHRIPHLHGWLNDAPVALPDEGGAEPVLRCRVRGTADLELVYELPAAGIDPTPPFSAGLRRKLMLTRLAGEERAARDLRLGTGSLLDRHLKTADMRAPVHTAIAGATAAMQIPAIAEEALTSIRDTFRDAGLPTDLRLGLVPVQGAALVGMVALMTGPTAAEGIPVTHAGTGTRQLALLSLSAALAGSAPVIVIDEPERGLEPYRQRIVAREIGELCATAGQAFVTTHAPAVLESLPTGSVHRMRVAQGPFRFEGTALNALLAHDPEAFFARLPIVCEGETEIGILDELLPGLIAQQSDSAGIRLVDGRGQPNILDILDGFIGAGIKCAAFLDNEAHHAGRRARIRAGCPAFIWEDAINIEDAACKWLPIPALFELILAAAEALDIEARHLEDQVYQAIPEAARQGSARELRTAGYSEAILRAAVYACASDRRWFKRRAAGQAFARMLIRVGMPTQIQRQIDAFGVQLRVAIA